MNRAKGILVAASLTGLVLLTFLALGFGRTIANSNDITGPPPTAPQFASSGASNNDVQQQFQAWRKYSQELEQMVRIMQERETQYQQQIESASQTIGQLQDEINRVNLLRSRSRFEEQEGHEAGEFDD